MPHLPQGVEITKSDGINSVGPVACDRDRVAGWVRPCRCGLMVRQQLDLGDRRRRRVSQLQNISHSMPDFVARNRLARILDPAPSS